MEQYLPIQTPTSFENFDQSLGVSMSNSLSSLSAVDRTLASFSRTTDEIFSLQELRDLLGSGRKLTLKFGADVTAPDLHIGHAVNLWMYREFQDLGHKVIFLIGDFTTGIGDPTGKNKLRPIIPEEQIQRNADEFIRQVKMVLRDDPDLFEIRRNSEWLGKLSAKDLLNLMSRVTNDHLRSREMFRRRIADGEPVYEHELIYPLLQGYDSVALKADITVIGSDQLFNEMMGRSLQEGFGQKPQVIITTKITPGIDGKEKQSKSIGNYIGLAHSPRDKFGRVMSIPDNLVVQYFEVYTKMPLDDIAVIAEQMKTEPMKCKLRLAQEIVARYHGAEIALAEVEWFDRTFSRKQTPDEAPVVVVQKSEISVMDLLIASFGQAKSKSELRRLVTQGGVKIDDSPANAIDQIVTIQPGVESVLKVGKRNWFRIAVQS